MSAATLDTLQAQRDEARDLAIGLASSDSFDPDNPPPEFTEAQKRAEALDKRVAIITDAMQARAAASKVGGAVLTSVTQREEPVETRSLGEQFINSDAFREYRGRGTSGRATLALGSPVERRAVIKTDEDPGAAFMVPSRIRGKTPPAYQAPLTALIPAIQVASGTVEWVDYPAAAPQAAEVPEGTQKPEADLEAQVITRTLPTIAHHKEITRQAVEDSQQLRDWINANLVRGVGDKIEAMAASELTGATLVSVEGADLMEAIRLGYAGVQDAGYNPTAVVLNPSDYAMLDLDVFRITGLPVSRDAFWGLQPVAASAVPAGEAYVGDFTAGMSLFYRAGTSVYVTDSHASNFTLNIFTVLAERRALPAVTTAEAIVKATVAAEEPLKAPAKAKA